MDPNWKRQLGMIEKKFVKKFKKEQEEKEKDDGDGWQIAM